MSKKNSELNRELDEFSWRLTELRFDTSKKELPDIKQIPPLAFIFVDFN